MHSFYYNPLKGTTAFYYGSYLIHTLWNYIHFLKLYIIFLVSLSPVQYYIYGIVLQQDMYIYIYIFFYFQYIKLKIDLTEFKLISTSILNRFSYYQYPILGYLLIMYGSSNIEVVILIDISRLTIKSISHIISIRR
jgi:hypothetical protein